LKAFVRGGLALRSKTSIETTARPNKREIVPPALNKSYRRMTNHFIVNMGEIPV
jgi:hypothetical protein